MRQKTQNKKIIIMASGNGSNFESICKACESGQLKATILKLIGDNPNAYVYHRAEKFKILSECIDFRSCISRVEFNEKLLQSCLVMHPDYIVLAGFMKILAPEFVNAFKQKIVNIHPSLLPKYPGTNAMEKAWRNQDSFSGVTVHYVDEGVDTGEIILQNTLKINYSLNFENFCDQMHRLEHVTYVQALSKLFNQ